MTPSALKLCIFVSKEKKQSIGLWVTRFWNRWPPSLQASVNICDLCFVTLQSVTSGGYHSTYHPAIISMWTSVATFDICVKVPQRHRVVSPLWWDAGNKNAATKLGWNKRKNTHKHRTNTNLQYWSIINLIPFSVFFNHTLWCHDMLWGEPVPVQMNQLESWQRQNCVKFTFCIFLQCKYWMHINASHNCIDPVAFQNPARQFLMFEWHSDWWDFPTLTTPRSDDANKCLSISGEQHTTTLRGSSSD